LGDQATRTVEVPESSSAATPDGADGGAASAGQVNGTMFETADQLPASSWVRSPSQ
jgi:hypothetical protein